jgi:hypothetical protein
LRHARHTAGANALFAAHMMKINFVCYFLPERGICGWADGLTTLGMGLYPIQWLFDGN